MYRALITVLLGLALLPGLHVSTAAAQAESPDDLVQAVNAYRAAHGRPTLQVHESLMLAAQRHATWMAVNHEHSHQGEGGSMPQDRATAAGYQGYVSENVAGATLGWNTVEWAVEGWAGSYGHRQTMLSDNVHIGAGIASNEEEIVYVLLVGSPSRYAPAPQSTAPPEGGATLSVVAVPITLATPREDGAVIHMVQPGQTAWAIAARYGVPLDELLALNHLDQNAILHPGDAVIIRLGEGQAPPPLPTKPAMHIVQEGESVWTIAALHGLTVGELLALNSLEESAVIHPGDQLKLRHPDPTSTPTIPPTEPPAASPTPPPAATAVALQPIATFTDTPVPAPLASPAPGRASSVTTFVLIAVVVLASAGGVGAVLLALARQRR